MSHNRFMFKLANGKQTKIRKNELYNFTLKNGLEISFQEQPAHIGEPVHTHVWVDPKNNDASTYIIDYIMRESMYYPIKFRTLAFLQFWDLENDEFTEDTDTLVEFVVDRKLSKTMSNGIMNWIEEIYESILGFQIMNNLFEINCEFCGDPATTWNCFGDGEPKRVCQGCSDSIDKFMGNKCDLACIHKEGEKS